MRAIDRSIPHALGLRRGDRVRIRSREEILSTLDERGTLGALPFMPEMLRFCGDSFVVSASAHKTCDTISNSGGRRMENAVHLADLRCDGSAHGGCQAACLLFWKEAWLEPVDDQNQPLAVGPSVKSDPARRCDEDHLHAATRVAASDEGGALRFVCQTTELVRATRALPWWDVRQYVRDLRSRNVSLGELVNAFYFRFTVRAMNVIGYRYWRGLYDLVQRRVGGPPFPEIEGRLERTPKETLDLEPSTRRWRPSVANVIACSNASNASSTRRADGCSSFRTIASCSRAWSVGRATASVGWPVPERSTPTGGNAGSGVSTPHRPELGIHQSLSAYHDSGPRR